MAKKATDKMQTPCRFYPYCEGLATVGIIQGAKRPKYSWSCRCGASGFFFEDHFKALDKDQKIFVKDD